MVFGQNRASIFTLNKFKDCFLKKKLARGKNEVARDQDELARDRSELARGKNELARE